MMAMNNSSRHETAFTVSIEAREGVSTGISAADRALTVATAINPQCTSADIATPGHVFPLRARRGGGAGGVPVIPKPAVTLPVWRDITRPRSSARS